jgi:hypothetical protein
LELLAKVDGAFDLVPVDAVDVVVPVPGSDFVLVVDGFDDFAEDLDGPPDGLLDDGELLDEPPQPATNTTAASRAASVPTLICAPFPVALGLTPGILLSRARGRQRLGVVPVSERGHPLAGKGGRAERAGPALELGPIAADRAITAPSRRR